MTANHAVVVLADYIMKVRVGTLSRAFNSRMHIRISA